MKTASGYGHRQYSPATRMPATSQPKPSSRVYAKWPPSPTVEDEVQSLRREHRPPKSTTRSDDVPSRGTVDQVPIILGHNETGTNSAALPAGQTSARQSGDRPLSTARIRPASVALNGKFEQRRTRDNFESHDHRSSQRRPLSTRLPSNYNVNGLGHPPGEIHSPNSPSSAYEIPLSQTRLPAETPRLDPGIPRVHDKRRSLRLDSAATSGDLLDRTGRSRNPEHLQSSPGRLRAQSNCSVLPPRTPMRTRHLTSDGFSLRPASGDWMQTASQDDRESSRRRPSHARSASRRQVPELVDSDSSSGISPDEHPPPRRRDRRASHHSSRPPARMTSTPSPIPPWESRGAQPPGPPQFQSRQMKPIRTETPPQSTHQTLSGSSSYVTKPNDRPKAAMRRSPLSSPATSPAASPPSSPRPNRASKLPPPPTNLRQTSRPSSPALETYIQHPGKTGASDPLGRAQTGASLQDFRRVPVEIPLYRHASSPPAREQRRVSARPLQADLSGQPLTSLDNNSGQRMTSYAQGRGISPLTIPRPSESIQRAASSDMSGYARAPTSPRPLSRNGSTTETSTAARKLPASPRVDPNPISPASTSIPILPVHQHQMLRNIPSLPACSRRDFVAGLEDWWTIPDHPDFDVCPACRTALVEAGAADVFVPSPSRHSTAPTRCDLSVPWMRMAWLLLLQRRTPHVDLVWRIATILAHEAPCPGTTGGVRNWARVYDDDSKDYIANFEICPACVRMLENIFPPLQDTFHFVAQPSRPANRTCDLTADSPRFAQYIDLLDETARKADEDRRRPDMTRFVQLARRMASLEDCHRDDQFRDVRWHFMSDEPDFTVCEACYVDVVWPALASGSSLAARMSSSPRAPAMRGAKYSCQLYSPRMRQAFVSSCHTNDREGLSAVARQRVAKERELQGRMEQALELPPEPRADAVAWLVAEWRRWE